MALDAKAKFAGLVTATAEATGEMSGLRIADNVVLRKEGALMPRPVYASSALPRQYAAMFPYKGQFVQLTSANAVYASWTGGQFTYSIYDPAGVVGASTVPALRADIQSAKEARGNFYVASREGVYKLTSTADTAFYRSGLTPTDTVFGYAFANSSAGNTLLTAGQQVAYRAVTVVVDPNGLVLRSRPTGAIVVTATTTSSPYLLLYFKRLPGSNVVYFNVAGTRRYVEVYRTRIFPSTVQVDDEMQLVNTVEVPTTSTTSAAFFDNVADTARGTTLYTSPSRGGIENANDRPPGCACLERFRGSLFFGNTVGPHRVVISYNRTASVISGSATGVGVRQTTGNTTSGSNQITGLASTTGVRVGQLVSTQTTGGMGMVTAIAGTTVTTAGNANVTTAGVAVSFGDALTIDNQTGYAYSAVVGLASSSGVGPSNYNTTSSSLGVGGLSGTFTAYEITPALPGFTDTVVIERIARGGAPFEVRSSRGDELSPAVPLQSAGGAGYLSANDVIPHGLAWTEPDEPEHCPPKNTAKVGDAGRAILSLVATKDRLLIFKEDGLFMLTGDTAKNFAIYPLDTTCLCILPGSVRRLKNTVFLLTNLGLCAVDENGSVSVVSRPIQLEVASVVNAIRAAQKSSGLYNMPGLSGVTGAGDDAQGEYHLALGSSTPSFGGQVLVYSLPRDGFTTFTFTSAPVALATDGEGNPLVLTASALLTPSTTLGTILARVSPRAFADPALLGKFWGHVLAGFSQLTGTTSVQAKFSSSASMATGASLTEAFDLPLDQATSLLQFPLGSLIRHPVPIAFRRAYMLFVELLLNVSNGTFTLEVIAAESSRENISNKDPTHGSGST